MSDIDFMGYKCTFHVDTDSKIHYEHNIRDPKLVKHEKHIDTTKSLDALIEARRVYYSCYQGEMEG